MYAKAVTSVRKELKVRKRDHPALFMLGATGKHLYEAVQAGVCGLQGFQWFSLAKGWFRSQHSVVLRVADYSHRMTPQGWT